jgi:glycosyltransferase involved in cell wall biosynthesis
MAAPSKILINAMHTTTGGGLVYLQNVLPWLAADKRFEFTLLMPESGLEKISVPKNVTVWPAPNLRFGLSHVWEQVVLPFQARGFAAMWCNANYAPLLARRPVPTIHTTPRAAAQYSDWGMWFYWLVLKALTRASLLRAPAALSVARHVIADYAGPRTARKVKVAAPAAPAKASAAARVPGLIITVGDYYPQKNYSTLLRAMKLLHQQLPKARLQIIGRPIDPAVAAQVKKTITELGLQKIVTEVGPLPHDKLLQRLAGASVFASLSQAECFNMPVLEAMSQGTPVIAGDYDFQHEVAEGAALYVPLHKNGDVPAAVATALLGLLLNPTVSSHLAKAGRARAKRFSWQKTAATIGETLAKVCALA